MPVDLHDTLVIGISATALFDLSEADAFFQEKFKNSPETAVKEYRQYMLEREEDLLKDGTSMPLVNALLALNQYQSLDNSNPLVDVVVLSRNSPETGVRVFNNIRHRKLNIARFAFTGGESVVDYLDSYGVDLFFNNQCGRCSARNRYRKMCSSNCKTTT